MTLSGQFLNSHVTDWKIPKLCLAKHNFGENLNTKIKILFMWCPQYWTEKFRLLWILCWFFRWKTNLKLFSKKAKCISFVSLEKFPFLKRIIVLRKHVGHDKAIHKFSWLIHQNWLHMESSIMNVAHCTMGRSSLKSIFLKKRTWQNQFIQKFAKTALPHSRELMEQFLQIFGWIDFVKYVL